MSNPITIVTALYDIDRENRGDGRKFDQYLSWFGDTLKVKTPMIVFVDQSLVSFVEKHRNNLPTKIIVQSLDETPYFNLTKDIDEILKSKKFKDNIGAPERIECKLALYNSIIYSKFQWVKKSIEDNPFDSEYFMWMDAGLSRFFYGMDLEYPSSDATEILLDCKDHVVIQTSMSYYSDLSSAAECTEEYFWDARTWVMAGLWGGGKKILEEFCNLIDDILRNKMIANKVINNEQNAMAYAYKNNPDMFLAFENFADKHRPYEFIQELSK
jgi:hypothetical protein